MLSSQEKATRSTIRKALRSKRQGLSDEQRQHAALNCRSILETQQLFTQAKNIAVYCDSDGEVPTRPIMELVWSLGKQLFLPLIRDGEQMDFVLYAENDSLAEGHFGIPVPAGSDAAIHPETLDLIIAPLVAFDKEGNRLGRGGGFYDRFMQTVAANQKPVALLGLAYEFQRTETLPCADWDRKLDAVITDKEILTY